MADSGAGLAAAAAPEQGGAGQQRDEAGKGPGQGRAFERFTVADAQDGRHGDQPGALQEPQAPEQDEDKAEGDEQISHGAGSPAERPAYAGDGAGAIGGWGDRYAGFSLADETGKDSSARGGGDILGFLGVRDAPALSVSSRP